MRRITQALLSVLIISSMSARAGAQEPEQEPGGGPEPGPAWELSLTPYLWLPAQDGSMTVRGVSAPVDLDIGDTFDLVSDHFNFGVTLHFEASRGPVTIFADAMYLSLGIDDVPVENGNADLERDEGIFEVGMAYRVVDHPLGDGTARFVFEPLAGVRVRYLSAEIDPNFADTVSADQAWVDGFGGARVRLEFSRSLAIFARGDIGGGESDLTWSAAGGIDFRFASWGSLLAGYRALDVDYDDGHGQERFVYDVLYHGPFIALSIRF